ncbi:hypothetical protein C8J57DRAFT_1533039 [Mycena rebaudengoi]|nr:hypothetical protein C8J57DRAFT_1533039 [Mycena rebaudengoi]
MAHAQSKILSTSTRHHSTVEQSSQDKENAQPRTTSSSHQGRQRDAAAGKANTSPRAGLDDEDLSDTENQDVDDRHRQSADDDEDESHHRRSRPRRASEKEAQRIEEKEAADARKHEKHAKAAKAAKKKELQASGQNDNDENLAPRRDDFTSRTVPSRPTATKNLAQRNSRIPPPPQFSEDRRPTQGGAGSGSSRDNVENDCRRHDRSDTGHFRGRSPLPAARSPLRPLVRNINDKVVPQRVQVDLRGDPLPHPTTMPALHAPALVLHTRALVLRVRAPALSTPAPTLHVRALALRGCPLAVPRVPPQYGTLIHQPR